MDFSSILYASNSATSPPYPIRGCFPPIFDENMIFLIKEVSVDDVHRALIEINLFKAVGIYGFYAAIF